MPLNQVQVFLSKIEPIRADESLLIIRNNQLGSGFMDSKDSKPAIRELEDQQRKLFVGYEAMEQRRAEMVRTLMASGLPLAGARGLPIM